MDLDQTRTTLLGGWTLHRWEIAFSDGRPPTLPFGADATGLILYTTDGWMSGTIAAANRPRLSSQSMRQVPVQEQGAAFASYFGYAGPFSLREVDGVPHVVHEVRHSLNPNFVGTEQVRRITFDGPAQLTLSAEETDGKLVRTHRLIWRRPAR